MSYACVPKARMRILMLRCYSLGHRITFWNSLSNDWECRANCVECDVVYCEYGAVCTRGSPMNSVYSTAEDWEPRNGWAKKVKIEESYFFKNRG